MELVSAIVCTYNRPVDTVLRAVKSIKNQTYQNIEIIVVNDCPGNQELVTKLESELKALDDKIRYYVNEENKGISANRNVGLSYAKGNIGSETAAACRMRELRANKVNFAENAEQNNHFADAGKMAGSDNDGLKNSVEQCSENVQQKRIEQSKEKPKKETVLQVYERLSQEIILPGMVEDKMMEWLKYKIERKESYKETGLKSLMKQVQKYVEQYGQESVVALIEECMGNNWAGIIWDRLEKGKVKTKQERMLNRVSEVDNW